MNRIEQAEKDELGFQRFRVPQTQKSWESVAEEREKGELDFGMSVRPVTTTVYGKLWNWVFLLNLGHFCVNIGSYNYYIYPTSFVPVTGNSDPNSIRKFIFKYTLTWISCQINWKKEILAKIYCIVVEIPILTPFENLEFLNVAQNKFN